MSDPRRDQDYLADIMGPETGSEPPGEGRDVRKSAAGPDRKLITPPGSGPGAERKILILLILMLICAVLGLAAGIMVIVARNTPGGGGAGALLPLLTLFT